MIPDATSAADLLAVVTTLSLLPSLPLLPGPSGGMQGVQFFLDLAYIGAPLAYIGPGAGLGAIGALLAVLGAILLGLMGLILYPYHLLRNRLRNRRQSAAAGGTSERGAS